MTPGDIHTGEWAHVRWSKRQHMITGTVVRFSLADKPITFAVSACGREDVAWKIWHDPPRPHNKPCASCLKAIGATPYREPSRMGMWPGRDDEEVIR